MGGRNGGNYTGELPRWHLTCTLYSEGDGKFFRYTQFDGRDYLEYWQMHDRIQFDKQVRCSKTRIRVRARRYGDVVPA